MSEDGEQSIGNAKNFLDVEAQEDFTMQEDEESEPRIVLKGSVSKEKWVLDSRGHFFMNGE